MTSSSILSGRGQENVAGLDIPWRFAPGPSNRYHKDTNPRGLISFATAEIVCPLLPLKASTDRQTQAGVQDELEAYVREHVTIPGDAFLYRFSSAGGPLFPIAMANFINANFSPFLPVTKDNIITAGGVTGIEDMLAFSLGDPGDGILVSAPIYGRFELDFGNEARLKIVYARMGETDSFEVGVVEQFEKAFEEAEREGIRIRAVLISNPSNPLGESLQSLHCQRSFDGYNRRMLPPRNPSRHHEILPIEAHPPHQRRSLRPLSLLY
jgi:1-aminocyclopropane-1-carboxylate synthase